MIFQGVQPNPFSLLTLLEVFYVPLGSREHGQQVLKKDFPLHHTLDKLYKLHFGGEEFLSKKLGNQIPRTFSKGTCLHLSDDNFLIAQLSNEITDQ